MKKKSIQTVLIIALAVLLAACAPVATTDNSEKEGRPVSEIIADLEAAWRIYDNGFTKTVDEFSKQEKCEHTVSRSSITHGTVMIAASTTDGVPALGISRNYQILDKRPVFTTVSLETTTVLLREVSTDKVVEVSGMGGARSSSGAWLNIFTPFDEMNVKQFFELDGEVRVRFHGKSGRTEDFTLTKQMMEILQNSPIQECIIWEDARTG